MRLRATRLTAVAHAARRVARPSGFTVLSSNGTSFTAPRAVLNSTGTSFTVPAAVLNSAGASFTPV